MLHLTAQEVDYLLDDLKDIGTAIALEVRTTLQARREEQKRQAKIDRQAWHNLKGRTNEKRLSMPKMRRQ